MPQLQCFEGNLAASLRAAFPEPPPAACLHRPIDEKLLQELLADQPMRLKHSLGVVRQGRALARNLSSRGELAGQIDQATLAHDIGYATALRRTGFHPLDGAIFLAHRGAEASVIHAVLHHSGARTQAALLPVAAPFYARLPRFEPTFLSDALTFCDMQTSPHGAPVTIAERIREVEGRYGAASPVATSLRGMEPEFDAVYDRVKMLVSRRAMARIHGRPPRTVTETPL